MAQESQKEELERKINTYLLQGTLARLMAVKAKHGEAMEIIYAVNRLLSNAVPTYIRFKDTAPYYIDEEDNSNYYLLITSKGLSIIEERGGYDNELEYYPYGHDIYVLTRLDAFITEFNKYLDELLSKYVTSIEKYTYYP